MMPPTGTLNGCDCPESLSTSVNGVLIDDVIPSIDTTQHGTWATELFVVNKNGQDSFVIGFWFNTDIPLREVEVTYLDCQIWGTGTSAINVYSSFVFPAFVSSASTLIGVLSLVDDTAQSCTSLKTVSIPIQTMGASLFIYIEFSFVGGSSVHPLNWFHLAEIRFIDVEPPTVIIITEGKILTIQLPIILISLRSSQHNSQHCLYYPSLIPTLPATDFQTSDGVSFTTTDGTTATDGLLTTVTVVNMTTVPTVAAIPITVFVGALMGIIVLLILLIFIIAILFYVYFSKCKTKENQSETDHENNKYDAGERGTELKGVNKTIEMKVNEAYGTCGQGDTQMDSSLELCVYEEVM